MKRILISFLFLGFFTTAFAAPAINYQKELIPQLTNTYYVGTTTSVWRGGHFTQLCLSGDCRTAWPTGGGSGGSISTSTIPSSGSLAFWTSPSTLSSVATGTLTTTATGLQFDATRGLVGGSAILSLTSGYVIPTTTRATNWDTAFGWGNHALVGYLTSIATSTVRGMFTDSVPGLTYTSSTGDLSLDSGSVIPTTTRAFNWDTAFSWGNHASQGYITDGNTGWDNIYGLITANTATATITNATTTNFAVLGNISLFGASAKATANDLCIQLTGSSALCDGSDDGGGGGGELSDWQLGGTGYIVPTTTVGISVSASSTIGNGTLGLTVNGPATTTGGAYFGGRVSIGTTTNTNLINVDGAGLSNSLDLMRVQAPAGYSGGGGAYFRMVNASGTTQFSVNSFGNFTASNGATFSGTVGTAPANGNLVVSPTSAQNGISIKSGAAYTGDYLRILDNSNNILLNFSGTTTFLGIGSSSPTRMLTVGGDIFTPNNLTAASGTITHASTTGLTVSGNVYIGALNGLLKATSGLVSTAANGTDYTLITSTTCGGTDKVSAISANGTVTCTADQTGSGGSSNWVRNAALDAITPSTTVGIVVQASSTISQINSSIASTTFLYGADLASCTGASNKLTWTGGKFACEADQTGGGGSKWTDAGLFSYLTDTADDLVFGSTATTTAPFWFDVSANQLFIGNGSTADSEITFGASTSPWTIGYRSADNSFTIASSTDLSGNPFLSITSTTSIANVTDPTIRNDVGVRLGIGTRGYYGLNYLLDHQTVRGITRNEGWAKAECVVMNGLSQLVADGPIPNCYGLSFYEDGTATLTSTHANGFLYGNISTALANDGAAVGISEQNSATSWMSIASNTPSMEVTGRIGTITAGVSSTTVYYIGMANEALGNSATFETEPTAGCYFAASTTQANWRAICRTSAAAVTNVDTGVPSTTAPLGSGGFQKFRIDTGVDDVQFYIKNGSSSMRMVANINTNIPTTTYMSIGMWFGRTLGTYTVSYHLIDIDIWWRKLVPDSG